MITLVTTFNNELFNSYAYRLIESFNTHADKDCNLLIVYEGSPGNTQDFKLPESNKIKIIPFSSECHKKFVHYFGKLNEANGYKMTEFKTAYLGPQFKIIKDFRFDAIRFSFKIFSIIQAFEFLPQKSMFAWIDADVICLKKFSEKDLLQFMPDSHQIMSYLGRNKFPIPNPYSECGFLGFNPNHSSLNDFLNRMKMIYLTGEIFSHTEWHDSWLWDQVRHEFENRGDFFKNLSNDIPDTHHPFINSNLGIFFDHLKGPERKKLGRSFNHDYNK